jgi:FixJ family two-component response regulator
LGDAVTTSCRSGGCRPGLLTIRCEEEAQWRELRERHESPTPRELEVMDPAVSGLPNKQVAARLETGEIIVKIHRGQVHAQDAS